ncbi:unnamed protein product [Pieris macdunnoughi]|uniref:Uncharacterized protein n=1 Tax=Pieris macdunnoughi TaxID=345717 RepID=A0A821LFY0_9NEOP|nr:unnamed protein product [Pieris macdunnoughi]
MTTYPILHQSRAPHEKEKTLMRELKKQPTRSDIVSRPRYRWIYRVEEDKQLTTGCTEQEALEVSRIEAWTQSQRSECGPI